MLVVFLKKCLSFKIYYLKCISQLYILCHFKIMSLSYMCGVCVCAPACVYKCMNVHYLCAEAYRDPNRALGLPELALQAAVRSPKWVKVIGIKVWSSSASTFNC